MRRAKFLLTLAWPFCLPCFSLFIFLCISCFFCYLTKSILCPIVSCIPRRADRKCDISSVHRRIVLHNNLMPRVNSSMFTHLYISLWLDLLISSRYVSVVIEIKAEGVKAQTILVELGNVANWRGWLLKVYYNVQRITALLSIGYTLRKVDSDQSFFSLIRVFLLMIYSLQECSSIEKKNFF